MLVYELLDKVDFQTEIHYCYYDYELEERIEITEEEARNKKIIYTYCENNEIYIEIEMEN